MSTERWEAIRAKVAELGRAHVRAGVVGPPAQQMHADTGMTNADLMMLHEYGNPGTNLPERRPVRGTIEDSAIRAEFAALEARIVKAVLLGKMSRDRGLELLGAWMASKIQARIVSGEIKPELAPRTIAAKGHGKVLVDTGQLAASVGWEIVK